MQIIFTKSATIHLVIHNIKQTKHAILIQLQKKKVTALLVQ